MADTENKRSRRSSDGLEMAATANSEARTKSIKKKARLDVRNFGAMLMAASYRLNTGVGCSVALGILKRIRNSDDLCSDTVLAAMPLLLTAPMPQVVIETLDVLGTAALHSYAKNKKIAYDKEIVMALIATLSNHHNDITKGVLNVILDLATTSIGRQNLRDFKAIDQLLLLLCQAFNLCNFKEADSEWVSSEDNILSIGIEKQESQILQLIFKALSVLVFDSDINHLSSVPKELISATLCSLKSLWARLQILSQRIMLKSECMCSIQSVLIDMKHCLAKLLFRFALEEEHAEAFTWPVDTVKTSIFGDSDSCFDHFAQYHWEQSPMIIRNTTKIGCKDKTLSSLIKSTRDKHVDSLLIWLLKWNVSCPPLTADNIDILEFLEEVDDVLGYPMIYGQDIHILKSKTKNNHLSDSALGTVEQHFFSVLNESGEGKTLVCFHDCSRALNMGYTIAIRGMEFRSKEVAAIADSLAKIFGQATVGANLYLTPPSSQGLSLHYDDHCVLVCQILGTKKWRILPPSKLLPRLYEPLQTVQRKASSIENSNEVVLMEGDILYIPRGFPHAAYTKVDEACHHYSEIRDRTEQIKGVYCENHNAPADTIHHTPEHRHGSCSVPTKCTDFFEKLKVCEFIDQDSSESILTKAVDCGYSLHLTFGIEVEPSFEWEGIIHIALYRWEECQNIEDFVGVCGSDKQFYFITLLLHIAIRNVGNSCSILRKACTASALMFVCDHSCMENESTKTFPSETFFNSLLQIVAKQCSLVDTVNYLNDAMKNLHGDDYLQWLRWLQHLPPRGANLHNQHWNTCKELLQKELLTNAEDLLKYESAFRHIKHKFCEAAKFDTAHKDFDYLLEKYRYARRKFTNAMLSLHVS